MKMGTKSLLFGCHQFALHPFFTLWGWVVLYGKSAFDWRVLLAIVIHDWGYRGCTTMDGDDGVCHPFRIKLLLFPDYTAYLVKWHSRHLSATFNHKPSLLCWADKYGLAVMPHWLWAVLAYMSGEGWEYMSNPTGKDYVEPQEQSLVGLYRFHKLIRRTILYKINNHIWSWDHA